MIICLKLLKLTKFDNTNRPLRYWINLCTVICVLNNQYNHNHWTFIVKGRGKRVQEIASPKGATVTLLAGWKDLLIFLKY